MARSSPPEGDVDSFPSWKTFILLRPSLGPRARRTLFSCVPLWDLELAGLYSSSLWGHFWGQQKVGIFFERFLLAIRSDFGRLLGCLGALLGRSVFPNYCKKQYKTMIFKFVLFRSLSSLGWLLEAIFANFGKVLGTKMHLKSCPESDQKSDRKIYQKSTNFGP